MATTRKPNSDFMREPRSKAKPKDTFWDKEGNPYKEEADKQEKRLAKTMGFKQTIKSGGVPDSRHKGDGQTVDGLFEAKKTTRSRGISITGAQVVKTSQQARDIGKEPVFIYEGVRIPVGCPKEWVIMPLNVYLMLTGRNKL